MWEYRLDPRANESTCHSMIDKARNGDEDAWSQIAAIYTGSIYEVCRKHRIQPEDAGDIAQITLMKIFEWMRKAETQVDSFRGYLHTTATSKAIDHYRGLQHETNTNFENVLEIGPDEAASMELEIEDELLKKALPLAEEHFEPLTVKVAMRVMFDGVAAWVVAEENGLSRSTVYSYVSRVKAFLRKEILRL